MTPEQLSQQTSQKLTATAAHFNDELKKLRTGRAHPNMLDGVMIEAYGTTMPLIQAGSISTPEAQLIQITPFDPNNIQAIVSSIRDNQNLGLNPTDDGRLVRIPIPALNEERRRDIVKQLHQKAEEAMISMRQTRQDVFKQGDQQKKDKAWSDDDHKRFEKQVDEMMAAAKLKVEQLGREKEQEIMKV